jgi:glycosyltransferase involved in cell wall biosynthesis
LKSSADELNLSIKFLTLEKSTPAEARNFGVRESVGSYLLFVDAGCVYAPDYVQRIVAARLAGEKHFGEPTLVSTIYKAVDIEGNELRSRVSDWSSYTERDWALFIPSARSAMVYKEDFIRVGGFAEWLSFAGEDTLLMQKIRRIRKKATIIPEELVEWQIPKDPTFWNRKMFTYGFGDGEAGCRDDLFYPQLGKASWRSDRQVEGYRAGLLNRPTLDVSIRDMKEIWVICSLTSFSDSGGAQRTSKLAQEIMNQGQRVIFLSAEPSYEDNPNLEIDLPFENLTLGSVKDDFVLPQIKEYLQLDATVRLLIEAPHRDYLDLVTELKKLPEKLTNNLFINLSVIDEWNGPQWGNIQPKQWTIAASDNVDSRCKHHSVDRIQ